MIEWVILGGLAIMGLRKKKGNTPESVAETATQVQDAASQIIAMGPHKAQEVLDLLKSQIKGFGLVINGVGFPQTTPDGRHYSLHIDDPTGHVLFDGRNLDALSTALDKYDSDVFVVTNNGTISTDEANSLLKDANDIVYLLKFMADEAQKKKLVYEAKQKEAQAAANASNAAIVEANRQMDVLASKNLDQNSKMSQDEIDLQNDIILQTDVINSVKSVQDLVAAWFSYTFRGTVDMATVGNYPASFSMVATGEFHTQSTQAAASNLSNIYTAWEKEKLRVLALLHPRSEDLAVLMDLTAKLVGSQNISFQMASGKPGDPNYFGAGVIAVYPSQAHLGYWNGAQTQSMSTPPQIGGAIGALALSYSQV